MPKLKSSLFAMLVIAVKRGDLCYIISLCYVVFALMAAFCLDCNRVLVHPRNRRGTSGPAFVCGNSCDKCPDQPNGCTSCDQDSAKSYLHLDQQSQRSYCVHHCPDGHYNHRSKAEVDSCKACGEGCRTCDSRSTCNTCMDNYYYYNRACYSRCPSHTRFCRSNNTCIEVKKKKCSNPCCVEYNECMSGLICAKKREKRKIKKTCKKMRKKCKNRQKSKRLKSPLRCRNRPKCRNRGFRKPTRNPSSSHPNVHNISN
uniref:Extracellular matrix protein FRAS1 n=1 Tax=Phallusia mammillata TaxID=59560 RepID=A0A6F9DCH2_9ASCI|nr:extracellular matrix protein FRAS1 [Phallusia mammillata]